VSKEENEIIAYRLLRARESLDEAALLFEAGHTNTYVNRLYYAAYYAVAALLLSERIETSRHARVRALLHERWVKPGRLPVDVGRHFDRLFDSRQRGDYADLTRFDAEEVADWLRQTTDFVDRVELLLQRDNGH
jgi:uncharacterized protein (UPF0332 family)